jgi:hypothetical protein
MALKTVGSLWVAKSGSKAKLSGYMDGPNRTKGPKVLILPNEKATPENRQPQYRICVEEAEDAKALPPLPDPFRPGAPTVSGNDDFQVGDDDVPF